MTLKVRIPDANTDPVVTGEMVKVGEPEIGELLGEMATDPAKLSDFGFDQGVIDKAQSLKVANGGTGEFPVVRFEEGWSNNNRLWNGDALDSIAEQINRLEPVGHLGHIPDEEVGTAMPDPQTTWIGAYTKMEPSQQPGRKGEQVKVLYAAGSNLPGAKISGYIKNRAVRGVSPWGRARQVPIPGKGVKIEGFVMLAFDWARKLGEGFPTSSILAVAGEQTKGDTVADKDLSQVTPDEFKEANPNGYALLVSQAVAEKDTKIGEMQTAIDAADEDKKLLAELRDVLKLGEGDDLLTKVANLAKRLGVKAKELVDSSLDALLEEKVADEDTRKLVKRLMPVAEMETRAGALPDDADDPKKAVDDLVSEMVTAAFDSDEMVQGYVSEQTTSPMVKRREQLRGTGSATDKAVEGAGMTRERAKL